MTPPKIAADENPSVAPGSRTRDALLRDAPAGEPPTDASAAQQERIATEPRPGWRARLRWPLMIGGPAIVALIALWFYLTGGRYQETDDAYVQAASVAISSNISGRVAELAVRDNQRVGKGELLFRLDDAPFRIAVQEAAAQLATARLQIESLKASYRQRQAELAAARDTVAFQERETARQRGLLASGISSRLQVDRAQHALDDARAQLAGAQQQVSAIVASLGGIRTSIRTAIPRCSRRRRCSIGRSSISPIP